MTALEIAPEARRDIADRVTYLQVRNPRAAAAFVTALWELFDALVAGRYEGTERTLRNGRVVRCWPLPPVVVYYERHPTVVRVVRVYDSRRRPLERTRRTRTG